MTIEDFLKVPNDVFTNLVYECEMGHVNLKGIFFDFDFYIGYCYTSKKIVSGYFKYEPFPGGRMYYDINYLDFSEGDYKIVSKIVENEYIRDSFDVLLINVGEPERYTATKFWGYIPIEFAKREATTILVIDRELTGKKLKDFLLKKLFTKQIPFNDLVNQISEECNKKNYNLSIATDKID